MQLYGHVSKSRYALIRLTHITDTSARGIENKAVFKPECWCWQFCLLGKSACVLVFRLLSPIHFTPPHHTQSCSEHFILWLVILAHSSLNCVLSWYHNIIRSERENVRYVLLHSSWNDDGADFNSLFLSSYGMSTILVDGLTGILSRFVMCYANAKRWYYDKEGQTNTCPKSH